MELYKEIAELGVYTNYEPIKVFIERIVEKLIDQIKEVA